MKQRRNFCSFLYPENERRQMWASARGTPEWAGVGRGVAVMSCVLGRMGNGESSSWQQHVSHTHMHTGTHTHMHTHRPPTSYHPSTHRHTRQTVASIREAWSSPSSLRMESGQGDAPLASINRSRGERERPLPQPGVGQIACHCAARQQG